MIYVECYADQALVEEIGGFTRKQARGKIIHSKTRSKVIAGLNKNRSSIGLIDEDPASFQPVKFLSRMKLVKESKDLRIYSGNDNTLIMLRPQLEGFVLSCSKAAKLDLKSYKLPDDANRLHEEVNPNLKKFRKLIKSLKTNENFKLLAKLFKEGGLE